MPTIDTTTKALTTNDGATLNYTQLGTGPVLAILPSSMCSATDYLRLAQALADSFTVCILDRRGHGTSSPIGQGHTMSTECADVAAFLKRAGAHYLFGHSIGGLISLQTALSQPLDKLVVYEPPLSIQSSISTDWLPEMQQALTQHHYAKAMTIIMKRLQLSSDASKLPPPLLTALIAIMMRFKKDSEGKSWGKHIISLLPTMPTDLQLVREMDSSQERFRQLSMPVLLLGGTKSAPHFKQAVQALAEVLPHGQRIELPGLEHNAPNQDAPEVVAEKLRIFFKA